MHFRTVASVFLIVSTASASCIDAPCNGKVEYCERKYSNVTLLGTHDSAFVGNRSDLRVNQEVSVQGQLDAGIRFLQAQTHVLAGELSMCHTSCGELYAGSLHDYLTTVKTWLDGNPNDVVSMLLVNGDNTNITQFATVFNAVGLDSIAFVPETTPKTLPIDDWPTYEEMILDDTRIVVYIDSNADETEVPYILSEFNYMWEDAYDTTDPNFNDCKIDRPPNSSPDGKMYLLNHFLDLEVGNTGILIPYSNKNFETNAATGNGSIGAQADLCESIYGKKPNFILVDMYDRGDVFTAQNNLNGV